MWVESSCSRWRCVLISQLVEKSRVTDDDERWDESCWRYELIITWEFLHCCLVICKIKSQNIMNSLQQLCVQPAHQKLRYGVQLVKPMNTLRLKCACTLREHHSERCPPQVKMHNSECNHIPISGFQSCWIAILHLVRANSIALGSFGNASNFIPVYSFHLRADRFCFY